LHPARLHPDPKVRQAARDALIEAADQLLKFYADQPPYMMSRMNILEFRLLALAHEVTGNAVNGEAARKHLSRLPIAGLQGGWYGGYPPPSVVPALDFPSPAPRGY
jgi:hypothetical protein